jgi:hypothetical protein
VRTLPHSVGRASNKLASHEDPKLKNNILRELHVVPYSRYERVKRTLGHVRRFFCVKHGDLCQRDKSSSTERTGLLQHAVPEGSWGEVTTGLVVVLPMSRLLCTIAFVVLFERLYQMVHLTAATTTISSKQCVDLFIKDATLKHANGLHASVCALASDEKQGP